MPRRTYDDWFATTPDLMALGELVLAYKEDKGFNTHSDARYLPSEVLHIISELTEAIEEARNVNYQVYVGPDREGRQKPEGFGIELAQAFVLLVGLMRMYRLNIPDLVALTMAYNEGRPMRHGKAW